MKKGLIFATTLAMALGVGAAVGAHQQKAVKVKAATNIVYLQPNIWATNSPRYEIYSWGGAVATGWVTMEVVETDSSTYKAEIPSDRDGLSFVRMDPAGDEHDWDAKWNQTVDLTFTAATPCYKVTAWGDSKSTGTWQAYEEPAAASKYYYSLNGGADVLMSEGSDNQVISASTSFEAGDTLSFKKDSEALAVTPKDDDAYTKVESDGNSLVFVQDYAGIIYLNTVSNKLWAGELDRGYYLSGSFAGWDCKHAVKAAEKQGEAGTYAVEGLALAANAEVKFIELENNKKEPTYKEIDAEKLTIGDGVNASISGGNLKFAEAGTYDLFYNSTNGWYSVENPSYVPPVYTMQIVGKSGTITLVQNEEEGKEAEYLLPAEYSFIKGEQVKFFKDDVIIDSGLKEDAQLTKLYVANAEQHVLEFAQAFEGKLVLDTSNNKVWAGQFEPGYYLAGVEGQWNPKLALAAHKVSELDPAYVVENVALAAGAEVKFLQAPQYTNEFAWFNPDGEKVHTDTEVAYSVVETEPDSGDFHLKVTNASTYDIYYNPTSGWYSIEDDNWVAPVYTVQVGETTYDLVLNEGTEYKIADHELIELTAGESVVVKKNGVAQSFARKVIGNNNLDSTNKVIANVSAQVYIDLNAETVFVGGIDFGGYHLLRNNDYVKMTENNEPLDPSFREFYSGLISFKEDDVVRFIDTTAVEGAGNAVVFDITTINESSEEGFAVVTGQLVAQKDVNLAVYAKIKQDANEVYFGSVAEEVALAKEFAIAFNSAIGAVCKTDNKTDLEALGTAWGLQVTAFGGLAEKVQDVLKTETKESSINEIAAFRAKYEYVAGKYGAAVLGQNFNFLGIQLSNPSQASNGIFYFTSENNTILFVTIGVTIAAMATLAFFVIRYKRKED